MFHSEYGGFGRLMTCSGLERPLSEKKSETWRYDRPSLQHDYTRQVVWVHGSSLYAIPTMWLTRLSDASHKGCMMDQALSEDLRISYTQRGGNGNVLWPVPVGPDVRSSALRGRPPEGQRRSLGMRVLAVRPHWHWHFVIGCCLGPFRAKS